MFAGDGALVGRDIGTFLSQLIWPFAIAGLALVMVVVLRMWTFVHLLVVDVSSSRRPLPVAASSGYLNSLLGLPHRPTSRTN
jgi:hypothetical protein